MIKENKISLTVSELRELLNKAGQSNYAFNLPIFSHEINILRKQLYIEQRTRGKEIFLKFIYQVQLRDDMKQEELEIPLHIIFSLSVESLFNLIKDSLRK